MSDNTENTLTSYLGQEFQQRLMWQLLVEPEFAEKTIPSLAIEYFDDPNLKRLFIIILEFFKEFEKVPNLQNQSILQAINKYKTPNNRIEEESLFAVIDKIKLWNERIINKQLLYDGDVVQKQVTSFIKQQEYRKIGEFILEKTKNGEIKNKHTIATIEDKFQKVAYIGDEEDYGTDVFEGIDRVLRKEFRETIPTGIHVIDLLTGGGLGKGEIGLILTPSGIGKTTILTKIANNGYEEQKNVLQIVFEDTIEQIQRKHFTIWAKSALSKMDDKDENFSVKKIAYQKAEEMMGKGNLVIKRFSQENTTMMDIRNWVLRHQKKYGYKFNIIILDYIDCLESHKKTHDRNEDELVIIKSFEALASDFNIPMWAGIQGNRSSLNAEFVEAYQTGGNIKRLQKAHFFMSVAKTDSQKEANFANIRILKARFAKDGQTFEDCTFNNDTMEIIINDKRYPPQTTLKKYGIDDADKISDTANSFVEKSTEMPIHDAIINSVDIHSMGSLTKMINSVNINNVIDDGVIKGVNEGVKNDDLLDIEDVPIGNIKNDVVNDGVKGLPLPIGKVYYTELKKEPFEWTGETFTVGTNEKEVKFEDVQPKIIVNKESIPPKLIPKIIITDEELIDIEKTFTDPDAPPVEDEEIYKILYKAEKHQNVIKKE